MGMADGGLAALPVPDMMFDEPTGGEFAGGGIVAFDAGGPVGVPDDMQILRDQMAYFNDPERQKADFFMGGQPKREASERLREFYSGALSEEGQKKRRDEDKWFALAQLGATMAGTPGSLLQAAGAGVKAALPGLQESSKERRAEQREAIKQLALDEGATNAEAREVSKAVMEGRLKATDIGRTLAEIKSREGMTEKEIASRERINAMQVAAQDRATAAAGSRGRAPDFMQSAVASRFAVLKQVNDRRPTLKKGQKFDENYHRVTDETLMNRAFKEVMGARYFEPFTEDKATKAAAMRQALGGQGGQGGGADEPIFVGNI
jgi:hypothetical protein